MSNKMISYIHEEKKCADTNDNIVLNDLLFYSYILLDIDLCLKQNHTYLLMWLMNYIFLEYFIDRFHIELVNK